MRLSVVLAAVVGIGATVLVLGFGLVFYGWETIRYQQEIGQLEADAYQEFVQRYPSHQERLHDVVESAGKTLETALNVSKALSTQGPSLELAGIESPGWKQVICQFPELAFGSLARAGHTTDSVILTGRAAQRATVKLLQDDHLELVFLPQEEVWQGNRLKSIPHCGSDVQGGGQTTLNNLFVLTQAPPVVGRWLEDPESNWGTYARILLEEGDAIAYVRQHDGTASVLTRPQVIGTQTVTVPGDTSELFSVTTADHRNTFLCLAMPLTGRNTLTWGLDLRSLLQNFAAASNRSLFLIDGDVLIPAQVAPDFQKIYDQAASTFLQPKILAEGFGKTKIDAIEVFFQQFIPLSGSGLRILLVDIPKAPGTSLDIALKEKAKSQASLLTFSLWVGVFSTVGLIGLAWLIGRYLGAPIRRAATEINRLLVGTEIGPRPSFLRSRIDEVVMLDTACIDLHTRMTEREKLQRLLHAFVAAPIAKRLEEGVVHPGGGRYRCAILFADIRGFTAQSSKMRADEVIILLNSCFEVICPPIEELGGVIDKFVGDEVMAIFGAPEPLPNVQKAAFTAALKMRQALHEFNTARQRRGLFPIAMGWGIASGEVTAGIVGSFSRSNFTALGTVVNLASRLCDAAGTYEILMDANSFSMTDLSDIPHQTRTIDLQGLGTQTVVGIGDLT